MISKVKSIIIYVLSVILAFESGLFAIFVCSISALHNEKEESQRKYGSRVINRNYYRSRKES